MVVPRYRCLWSQIPPGYWDSPFLSSVRNNCTQSWKGTSLLCSMMHKGKSSKFLAFSWRAIISDTTLKQKKENVLKIYLSSSHVTLSLISSPVYSKLPPVLISTPSGLKFLTSLLWRLSTRGVIALLGTSTLPCHFPSWGVHGWGE